MSELTDYLTEVFEPFVGINAIGNTTNLAARLQSLTRDLNAALVIDAVTWERAQPAAEDFEKRPEVPIRGRRETQDVYALPMRSAS